MRQYCIEYKNAGSGEAYVIKRNNAEDAFVDLVEILDNPSNYDISAWIENNYKL